MATSMILLSHLRRSNRLSTRSLSRVSHLPYLSAPLSHPNISPSVSPLPPSISRSFFSSAYNVEESILPVRAIVSLLDGYHNLSGFPWWITIATATVGMRFALLPAVVIHLQKLKRIGELGPKLPSPLPSTMSGRSYMDQILHFRKERKAIGCPSFLWFLAPFFTQVPCLLLWVTSIRRMSLDNHPGFDSGGALWFQNLTELPHGVLGPIFPFLIASLHYINVQISFGTSSVKKADPLLAKVYKFYLDFLTLPFFGIGFLIPQGSLVYWVTNSSLSLIQQLTLKHPAVRAKLGLPDKDALARVENSGESSAAGTPSVEPPSKQHRIAVQNLSPKELLALSIKHLSREDKDLAISLLKLALDKDPEYVKAMVVMGQTLMQKGLLVEASEYLEDAISKLSLSGHLTEVEDVDHLILSSQWAGVVYMKQGKKAEGLAHLERIANLKEPEDPKSKAHYFDGLLLLSSALLDSGRKVEALKFLRLVVAYNPNYNYLLEEVEKEEDNFASGLVNSRRRDY
ncbi:ALBINO3-like protein 2, chloroplastic isoform X2 [Herrania umbratica]|uniref:ALBINO3-like protein 2, chloroplastic isoform X2 n=1 Tax=Herrania umbratica TaxID=108875 RepID=A0A6J1A644_9ROSI|nr:ALBINO3-like protein 2, chloroplastic isoform X2 [Herrania umbratica]